MKENHDYRDFHYLVEIVVNYVKIKDEEKRISTPKTRWFKTHWERRMREWIKANYEDAGIIEDEF